MLIRGLAKRWAEDDPALALLQADEAQVRSLLAAQEIALVRNISFALTTEQVRNRTKTVTRRLGWKELKPGTLLQPVEKARGLKKGEKVRKIGGPITITSVHREMLSCLTHEEPYGSKEVEREGFAGAMTPREFVAFFCRIHRCTPAKWVTRIEFSYVEAA